MRMIAIAAAAIIAAAALPAAAAPADVQVTIGPDLQKKAAKTLGVRDIDQLAAELRHDVEWRLERTGVLQGARVELTLADAQPNRPTFKQMSQRPGLSFSSFGVGGAKIEGRVVTLDGAVTPISYSWYESDIRQARNNSTWQDAETAFSRFARKLSRGEQLAVR